MSAISVVVLAAGEGKRFRSSKPKVLHEVCGVPILGHVLRAAAALRPASTVVVIGRGAKEVQTYVTGFSREPASVAVQKEQLGTADATRIGVEALGRSDGDVLVLPGDTPLLTAATLRTLVKRHVRTNAAATVLTAELWDPTGYGRIVRADGALQKIVEETDCTKQEREIMEVNSSVWVFDRTILRSALSAISRDNAQREFYLTDIVELLVSKGEVVESSRAADAMEIHGVNTRAQLAEAMEEMRELINAEHMDRGVTLTDPYQTYIDADVRIGADTVITAPCFIGAGSVIGRGCQIGPGARIAASRIGDASTIVFSTLDNATVAARCSIGPYAYLRPGARLDEGAKAGSFVEIKASRVGKGSKVPHLSYIGDADIGADVNIGAGTITCNYDGVAKHKTVIGDGAFIGSDTMLVAPVRIGAGAMTGAGSAIAKDVPPGALGIERTEQRNVKGWAARKRPRGAKKK